MTRRCSAFLNAELAFSCWFGSFKFKRTCGEHKRLSSNNLIQAGSFPTRQMDFYSRSQFIKNANSLKRLSLQPVTALSSIRIFRIRSTFLKKNKKKKFFSGTKYQKSERSKTTLVNSFRSHPQFSSMAYAVSLAVPVHLTTSWVKNLTCYKRNKMLAEQDAGIACHICIFGLS